MAGLMRERMGEGESGTLQEKESGGESEILISTVFTFIKEKYIGLFLTTCVHIHIFIEHSKEMFKLVIRQKIKRSLHTI